MTEEEIPHMLTDGEELDDHDHLHPKTAGAGIFEHGVASHAKHAAASSDGFVTDGASEAPIAEGAYATSDGTTSEGMAVDYMAEGEKAQGQVPPP
jgi:hypothetical protein